MMDGRIGADPEGARTTRGLLQHEQIMSYAAKYALQHLPSASGNSLPKISHISSGERT